MSDEPEHTPESAMGDTRERLTGPRYYDATKNPGTEERPAAIPGAPLRDLEAEEFEALPVWLQHSIDTSPMYRRTRLSRAPATSAPKPEKET